MEIVLSADLGIDDMGEGDTFEPLVLAFLDVWPCGDGVSLVARVLLFLGFMGSPGSLGESELGVGDHGKGGGV